MESPEAPLSVRFVQLHVVPERSPRCTSMAPQYIWLSRSGATARNQSYQACPVLAPGGAPMAVHVPLARHHKYGVAPLAPHAYATVEFDGAMATANRLNDPGVPGSATAVQVVPPSVDRSTPSLQAARISADGPPPGAI